MSESEAIPFKNLKEHLEKRAGDKDFMLKVLAHITNRDHVFFNKDFVPATKQVVDTLQFEFDNQDNFFNGLPDSKHRGKHSQAMNLLIPKD